MITIGELVMTRNKSDLIKENSALREEIKRLMYRQEALERDLTKKKNDLEEADRGLAELHKLVDAILITVALKFGESAEDGCTNLELPHFDVAEVLSQYDVLAGRTGEGDYGIIVKSFSAEESEE